MSDSEPRSPAYQVPASIVREALSDDELVVLDSVSHRFYSLNSTAKRVFELAAEGLNEEGVSAHLSAEFDIAPEECAADVRQLLAELVEQGLLTPPSS